MRVLLDDILRIPSRRMGDAPFFVTRQGKSHIDNEGRCNAFDHLAHRLAFEFRCVALTAHWSSSYARIICLEYLLDCRKSSCPLAYIAMFRAGFRPL